MKHIRLFIAAWAVFIGFAGLVPAIALADTPQSTVCQTLGSNGNCTSNPTNGVSLNSVIKAIINILSLVVGVVAVIMVIIGGFRYITSGGDSNNVTSAKNTILYAIVGLVVVALAQAIVKFVLNKLK
jgi:predicted permease